MRNVDMSLVDNSNIVVSNDPIEVLRYHEAQSQLWISNARFNIVPAGRRSGKTEIVGKRKVILRALRGTANYPQRFFIGAPTRDQAKRIYWGDLKRMVPRRLLSGEPRESSLILPLINGNEIHVLGMDKPERIEGTPWDGGVLDEYGNMKSSTWPEHVRPALSSPGRLGWCDFIGVPEGRNHYFELEQAAKRLQAECLKKGIKSEWNVSWWPSSDILPASEIEAAKRDLDELTFMQEYEGSFVNFSGLAYYNFNENLHLAKLQYNPNEILIFTFDFNISPGVCPVIQMQDLPHPSKNFGIGIIGEAFINRFSNTLRICDRLIQLYGNHQGPIFCYGDATGGAEGSAKVLGSDWQLIKQKLWTHFGKDQVEFRVPNANPRERDRINSVNSRLYTFSKEIYMMMDPEKAPETIKDFAGTVLQADGKGKVDKLLDKKRGHITDAIGYFTHREWPVKKVYQESGQTFWQ